jgi:hypothetical protein
MLAQVLAMMQATTAKYLTETCTILVQIPHSDPEAAEQWHVVASGVLCRVITVGEMNRAMTAVTGERENLKYTYALVCPVGTPLAADQKVVIDGGAAWHVVGLITDRTSETDEQAIIERWIE